MSENIGFAILVGTQQVVQAADVGFKSVINACPDYKQALDQPTSSEMNNACIAKNLSYAFCPIQGGYSTIENDYSEISDQDAINFATNYNSMTKPVLLLGETGSRAIDLHLLALQMDLISG